MLKTAIDPGPNGFATPGFWEMLRGLLWIPRLWGRRMIAVLPGESPNLTGVMEYRDFDLLIERAAQGYRAQVLNSPAGQATAEFVLPFSDVKLENFLLRLGRPARRCGGSSRPR